MTLNVRMSLMKPPQSYGASPAIYGITQCYPPPDTGALP